MGPTWGRGAHTKAIEGIEMPLFSEYKEKEGDSGTPDISVATALTAFLGLRCTRGTAQPERSAWAGSTAEPMR